MQAKDGTQLDPGVAALVKAIRRKESGGDYKAVGDNGTSSGGYQYQKATWQGRAKEVGLDPNDFSPTNQDKVTYYWAKARKDAGWTPEMIAAGHNTSEENAKSGAWKTMKGVKTYDDGTKIAYDVPDYVNKVMADYKKQKDAYTQESPETRETETELLPSMIDKSVVSSGQEEGIESKVVNGVADVLVDPFKKAALATHNVFTSPENDIQGYKNFSGDVVNTPGYVGGQADLMGKVTGTEATAGETAKQAVGTGLGIAATAVPWLRAGKAAFVAAPLRTSLGLGYATDVGENFSNGDKISTPFINKDSAFNPGINTAFGGGFGLFGKGAKLVAKPASEMKSEALKNGLDDIFNRNQSVKNAYAKNTVTRATSEIGADGKPLLEKIGPDSTFIQNEFKPKVTDGRVDTRHIFDPATKEGSAMDLYDSLDNGLNDVISNHVSKNKLLPLKIEDLRNIAAKSVKDDKTLVREGKVDKVLADVNARFDSYAKSYPDGVSIDEVNKIRKVMNSPRNWNPDTQDVDRAVGNAARSVIYKIPGAKDLLQQQQLMKTAMNYAKAMNGKVVKGGRLGNMFWMWFGSKLGQATGIPIAGDIVGLIGGRRLSEGLQNLTFNSPIGEIKSKLGGLLRKSELDGKEIENIVRDLQVVSEGAESSSVDIKKPSSLRDILLKGSKDLQKQDTTLEKYVPDSELPTIDMGTKGKSKYLKDTGLPTAKEAPSVYSKAPQGDYIFEDKFGGSVAATIKGDTARIYDAFAKEKGHGLYENTIKDLASKGIAQVEISLQSVDSTKALNRLVEKGLLRNPRNKSDVGGYPTLFDVVSKTKTKFNKSIPGLPQIRY